MGWSHQAGKVWVWRRILQRNIYTCFLYTELSSCELAVQPWKILVRWPTTYDYMFLSYDVFTLCWWGHLAFHVSILFLWKQCILFPHWNHLRFWMSSFLVMRHQRVTKLHFIAQTKYTHASVMSHTSFAILRLSDVNCKEVQQINEWLTTIFLYQRKHDYP